MTTPRFPRDNAFYPGRRRFITGALATGALGLVACSETQTVQVAPTPSAPPSELPAPTPSSSPMPVLPPFEAKTYSPNLKNAILAGEEIVDHFSKVLDTPSALIHAVRCFGKNYQRANGSSAVEHLCATCAEEKTANGQTFVHFKRAYVEVHENSFLKTFIEAGVQPDQQVIANGRKYSLKDVGEHAKALFRIDTSNLAKYESNYTREHLPWGLIALTSLMPGGKGNWTNAWGEKIDLMDVIDKALAEFEGVCAEVGPLKEHESPISDKFHQVISTYSCFGGHALYSFVSCLSNGYTDRDLKNRVSRLLDLNIYRASKEFENLEKIYTSREDQPISPNPQEEAQLNLQMQRAGVEKKQLIQMLILKSVAKLTGHIFEAINYAKLTKVYTPAVAQQKYIQVGQAKLFESLVKLRAFNLEAIKNFNAGQVNEVVIAVAHATRGLKLLTAENPDHNSKAI